MYLKSLTLKGFKSFANKSVMRFEPGLTVVVGPNGSGKSNISDAILWVLGEQSAKQLRGQAMEDVIFAGSSVRAAVGVAEVTLVLDNTDHTLPVDYTEVAITRRMYRSGESEYLINGSSARLRDIQDILHDSGLGKDAHSIISQGKLEQVLTSKPEERRVLIEEAAGISKHRRRKERSVKKLAQMDASLMRAKDLERSLMRQLRPLERQVDKANQFKIYDEQIHSLQTALAVDDLRQLKAKFDDLEAERAQLDAACEVSRLMEQQRNDEAAKLEALLEERGLFAGDLTMQRQEFCSAQERIATLARLAQQKAHHARSRLQSLDVQEENCEKQIAQDGLALEELSADFAGVQAQLQLFEGRIANLRTELTATKQLRQDLDRACGKAGHHAKELRREADHFELELSRAQGLLKNAEVQKDLFATRLERLAEERNLHRAELEVCAQQVEQVTEELGTLKEAQVQCERSARLAQEELRSATESLHEHQRQADEIAAELNALNAVEATLQQSNDARALLATHASMQKLAKTTLAQLIGVPEHLEVLVEGICQDYLGDYLVSQDNVGRLVQDLLTSNESGRVRLFLNCDQTSKSYPKIPGASHLLDQLRIDPAAQGAFELLLGAFYVVDTTGDALSLARQYPAYIFVSADGCLHATGAYAEVSCRGVNGKEVGHTGHLARMRRMKDLNKRLKQTLEGIDETYRPEVDRTTHEVQTAQLAWEEAKQAQSAAEQELELAKRELDRLQGAQKRLNTEYEQVQERARELMSQAEESQERMVDLQTSLTTSRLKQQQAEDELKTVQSQRDQARIDEQEQQERLNAAQLEEATVRERAKYLETRVEGLQTDLKRLRGLHESACQELQVQRMVEERIEPLIHTLLTLQQMADFWSSRIHEQVALEQEGSHELKQRVKEARLRRDEALEHTKHLTSQIADLNVLQGKLEVQVEQAISAINETGAILEEALSLEPMEDRGACEAELTQLKAKIDRLGPINHVAMHQYEELKAQHTYIAQQTADLDYARKAIQKIIATIDRKMKDQFLTTFAQVDANFREIFATLFDGGRAHLELTDPDQPHETGIEVIAQPRGKRLSKMTLLSGGEKSLTAISLLFALYKTRTVPFYVLDEIEAALDDANLGRLLRAIDEFKTKTQLIVVSHQRKTMERADVLYGVSMHADGISQVVSQRLNGHLSAENRSH